MHARDIPALDPEAGRFVASTKHLHESVMFRLVDGEFPGSIDRDPIDNVLTSIRPVSIPRVLVCLWSGCRWPLWRF